MHRNHVRIRVKVSQTADFMKKLIDESAKHEDGQELDYLIGLVNAVHDRLKDIMQLIIDN